MSEELYTADEIAHNYTVMGHSVGLINQLIAGTARSDYTTEQKKECMSRNIEHLEIMVAQDYWTTEDMTAVNKAITDGKGYL
jgi:hypothetical protein